MNILLFLGVLVVLIVVHELGHFLAAKMFGIKVEEFGIGYPPRALTIGKIGETVYSLNWLPFGGFVKIFGEGLGEDVSLKDQKRALINQAKWKQATVLVAGVVFNIIFAWILFTVTFMMGSPVAIDEAKIKNGEIERNGPVLAISAVLPDSPADIAGLRAGDSISALAFNDTKIESPLPSEVSKFVSNNAGETIKVYYNRNNKEDATPEYVEIIPTHGIIAGKQGTAAIGVEMVLITAEKQGFFASMSLGAAKTISVTKAITIGTVGFIKDAVTGNANWKSVAGPVGIVGLVGDASSLGWMHLINFMAIISINLAIINMIPIPALDGGRLLFVGIESITRQKIHPGLAGALNILGFAAIILLMVVITYHDVAKIIN